MEKGNYKKFGLMMLASFITMYALMFINASAWDHIMLSNTRTYMAICMIAAMAIIMLLFMLNMYKNKKMNAAILIGSAIIFIGVFTMLRKQTAISDVQWMQGMIPHHSSAIMTSKNAHLKDPEAIKLAEEIIEAQKREIAQMKKMIYRLENESK